MMKPGQILEDIRIYPSSFGSHTFATLIEDADSINLDNGFTAQESEILCPSCNKPANIRLMAVSCMTGHRVLCNYCSPCHLLFRSIVVGSSDWQGNYIPNKEYE